jgi:RNase H-like domain found in reverse transcriptase
VAFYSAKLNSAQQDYSVHEIELMAGIKTMLCHADILQGVWFKWVTDHKGLTHLLNQKNLSGRQAQWLEKISSFDFEVVYVPGNENVLADALSQLYSYNSPGTVSVTTLIPNEYRQSSKSSVLVFKFEVLKTTQNAYC